MVHKLFLHKYIKELAVLIIFVLTVAIFYGNTLQNGFVLDDHFVVETNTYAHSLKYLPKVITSCTWEWEAEGGTCSNAPYYRPLLYLSHMLTYQISPNPWPFALVRMIYFTISIFLVFTLVKLLTKNFLLGFLSALIFLIHPLKTEAVNFSAVDILYTIFALLATIFYFLHRSKDNRKYLLPTYIFYGLGVFSKEPAVLMPFIFLTLDFLYFKKKIKIATATLWLRNDRRRVWQNIKPYFIYFVIFLAYLGIRFWMLNTFVANGATNIASNLTITQITYIFFYLFASFTKAFFWPYPLNFWHIFNPSYKLWDLHFLSGVLLAAGFLGACFIAWKKKWGAALFALVWFFVFLFPILAFSNFIGSDNKFAERFSFAPLIGFSILLALILDWFWKNWRRGKIIVPGFLSIIIIPSFFIVYNQNKVWRDDISIELDTLKKSPEADGIRYNLALAYQNRGDLVLAKETLIQIIKQDRWKDLYRAYYGLGNIYRQEKNFDEAIRNFQTSIEISPYQKEVYNNLGALLLERGDFLNSTANLCKAISLDPKFKDANNNFNVAASNIQGLDNKSFMKLSDQMLSGNAFKPAASVISSSLSPEGSSLRVEDLRTESEGSLDSFQNKSGDSSPAKGRDQNDKVLKLEKKDCNYPQGCILIFSSKLSSNTFFFPFLTMGKTDNGEVVRARYFEFNPQTSEIAIGIDREFEDSNINFYIPTCEGVYYEGGSE